MVGKVKQFIKKHELISADDHVLAAVSGGADSICLLYLLHDLSDSLGFRLTVAHLDHGIRGRAAAADAAFVAGLTGTLGLECRLGSARVPARARREGISLEMAARKVRYDFLVRTARKLGAAVVATAHTADDQAETLILNLARGTGRGGLGGIPRDAELKGLRLVRPLLNVSRDEIESFLRKRGATWREDESNRDVCFLRNRVRHEILPLLESRLNPSLRNALVRTADVLHEEDAWLDQLVAALLVQAAAGRDKLDVTSLRMMPLAARRRVLRMWFLDRGVAPEGITFEVLGAVERLLGPAKGSRSLDLSGGWVAKRAYDVLSIRKGRNQRVSRAFRVRVGMRGETLIADPGLRVTATVEPGLVKPGRTQPGRLPACASIRHAALRRRHVVMRSWRPGDRIRPLGMAGSRKLQDVFVDGKVPRERRAMIPVFECGGEIIWVPGYRVARGWEVREITEPALQLCVAWL